MFKITSLDVIHSFFVPEFSEKLDAVPGIVTTLRVTPTRIGSYPAECTELCGSGPFFDAGSGRGRNAGPVRPLAGRSANQRAAADRVRRTSTRGEGQMRSTERAAGRPKWQDVGFRAGPMRRGSR